jgi:hypothetical protein
LSNESNYHEINKSEHNNEDKRIKSWSTYTVLFELGGKW